MISPAILIGATLLQTTIFPFIEINQVHPDLVFVVVIGWIILRGLREGLVWALLGGLCLDLVSGAPFGIWTLALILVALVANLSHGRVFGSSIVLPLSLTFPLSFVFNGLALLFLYFLGRSIVWVDAFSNVLFPAALFNTAAMILIFPLLYLLNRTLHPQQLSF